MSRIALRSDLHATLLAGRKVVIDPRSVSLATGP
jgi:hypothetical protein